jgi:hypothetical protein
MMQQRLAGSAAAFTRRYQAGKNKGDATTHRLYFYPVIKKNLSTLKKYCYNQRLR